MADVMEFANQLGAALAEDARYVAMRAATEALKEDAGAKKLEEEYAEAVQLIHQKTAQGAATVALQVDRSLIGTAYYQWAVVDRPANALGAVTSEGMEVRF